MKWRVRKLSSTTPNIIQEAFNRYYLSDIISGRRGIEPKTGLNPFLKTALNVFCMHKTDFFSRILFSLSNLMHWRL